MATSTGSCSLREAKRGSCLGFGKIPPRRSPDERLAGLNCQVVLEATSFAIMIHTVGRLNSL
jgi:hypothetical protein